MFDKGNVAQATSKRGRCSDTSILARYVVAERNTTSEFNGNHRGLLNIFSESCLKRNVFFAFPNTRARPVSATTTNFPTA